VCMCWVSYSCAVKVCIESAFDLHVVCI
jgi:hypothetical protein